MKILLTGGTGFVGSGVSTRLAQRCVVAVVSSECGHGAALESTDAIVDRLPKMGGWDVALEGCGVLVHLAGLAHARHRPAEDSLSIFRQVNVDGTVNLARLALDRGVRRFVFVSSIGVNGGSTSGSPVTELSAAIPHADYALSKWEAEQALWEVVNGTDMELVIIRPPLVYAGQAPGNFNRLLKLIAGGVPLPLSLVCNQRSIIALENLVDFIALCIDHPAAANELFVISDGEDVSTPEIVRHVAEGMGKPSRLFPVPQSVLHTGARLVGKINMYSQLCDSLVIDSSKARNLLGWRPVVSTYDALKKAGYDFLNSRFPS